MDELISRQKLPTKSKARELLRVKGQFWTPLWIAKPMLLYASTGKTMYDPSVGSGIFFNTQYKINKKISMNGMEHDSAIIPNEFKHRIKIGDFLSEYLRDYIQPITNVTRQLLDSVGLLMAKI